MNYKLDEPTPPEYRQAGYHYIIEAWSPIYPDYPYDSDSTATEEQAIAFLSHWQHRFDKHYALIIRGPDGARIIRPITEQEAD